MKITLPIIKKWAPAVASGAVLAIMYLYLLNQQSPVGRLSAGFIYLYLWAFFSLAVFLMFNRLLSPRLSDYPTTWRRLWLAGCLGAGVWLAHNIPVRMLKSLDIVLPQSAIHKVIFLVSAGFGIGLLLFAASALFATLQTKSAAPAATRRMGWLLYALPMLLAWLIYLLAYWPGMMSADSLNQWGQALSGHFIDHHPAFHTFLIWLLTRIYPSPALVALVQILALGLLAGYILGFFETQGAPRPILWLASLVFALSPVNGTMVNTLWKDVLYGAALVGLTFLVYRIAASQGSWMAGRWSWAALGSMAALLSLLRQNGWPIAFAIFPILLLAYSRQWKPLLAAFLFFGVLYLGIRGPFYRLLDVKKSTVLLESSTSIYSIAAHADAGSKADSLLESIQPFSKGWECETVNSLGQVSQLEGLGEDETPIQTVINIIRRAPGLLMYSYRCQRSLVWIIYDPYLEVRNPSHAQYWIDANKYGIEPDSRIPEMREQVSLFVDVTSKDPDLNWFIWRPALYLYFFLFVVAVQALKYKDLRWLLLGMPILIQSVLLTLILILPNFRYHYAAVLLPLLFWPTLCIPGAGRAKGISAPAAADQEQSPAAA